MVAARSSAAPSSAADAPIALFDSGVGGLTVLEALARRRPEERLSYVADQAHVPYGGRPLSEIRDFAEALTAAAFRGGAKLVVMACNISSATYGAEAVERFGRHRVLGVIGPGAETAAALTRSGAIGVLATAGTVQSHAYRQAVAALDSALTVYEVACPAFVPLIERGALDGPEAEAASREALDALPGEVDTVVYGCTHYPFLASVLTRLAPERRFVDPAEATAARIDEWLRQGALPAATPSTPTHVLATTGDPTMFKGQAERFLDPQLKWKLGPRATSSRAA